MAILSGKRLGPYEILSAVGAGGMGEVYRAKDTRLDRIVAIKILSAHLADRCYGSFPVGSCERGVDGAESSRSLARPDGQKFLINSNVAQSSQPITLYANWTAGLKK